MWKTAVIRGKKDTGYSYNQDDGVYYFWLNKMSRIGKHEWLTLTRRNGLVNIRDK